MDVDSPTSSEPLVPWDPTPSPPQLSIRDQRRLREILDGMDDKRVKHAHDDSHTSDESSLQRRTGKKARRIKRTTVHVIDDSDEADANDASGDVNMTTGIDEDDDDVVMLPSKVNCNDDDDDFVMLPQRTSKLDNSEDDDVVVLPRTTSKLAVKPAAIFNKVQKPATPIVLDKEQNAILSSVIAGRNVFFTGSAGRCASSSSRCS